MLFSRFCLNGEGKFQSLEVRASISHLKKQFAMTDPVSKVESGRKDIRTVKIRDDDLPTYALIILFSKEHGL